MGSVDHGQGADGGARARVAEAFRLEYARVVASVLRTVRDVDAAEEIVQEAFAPLRGSPVVELNRAVAIGLTEGPEAGLAALDRIDTSALRAYHLLSAARADFLRPLGRWREAAAEYRRALDLADNVPEQRLLAARLAACEAGK